MSHYDTWSSEGDSWEYQGHQQKEQGCSTGTIIVSVFAVIVIACGSVIGYQCKQKEADKTKLAQENMEKLKSELQQNCRALEQDMAKIASEKQELTWKLRTATSENQQQKLALQREQQKLQEELDEKKQMQQEFKDELADKENALTQAKTEAFKQRVDYGQGALQGALKQEQTPQVKVQTQTTATKQTQKAKKAKIQAEKKEQGCLGKMANLFCFGWLWNRESMNKESKYSCFQQACCKATSEEAKTSSTYKPCRLVTQVILVIAIIACFSLGLGFWGTFCGTLCLILSILGLWVLLPSIHYKRKSSEKKEENVTEGDEGNISADQTEDSSQKKNK